MRVPALVELLMPGRLLTTGCVAAAALAVAHAQQQPPTFGATTRTIAVYATVTDPQGRLAPDLTRDNFARGFGTNSPSPVACWEFMCNREQIRVTTLQ
jgi:hypothetical protein